MGTMTATIKDVGTHALAFICSLASACFVAASRVAILSLRVAISSLFDMKRRLSTFQCDIFLSLSCISEMRVGNIHIGIPTLEDTSRQKVEGSDIEGRANPLHSCAMFIREC